MTDSIIAAAKPDGFTHESPIRAFTEFKVNGKYAIGKGFRPSMAHLGAYLDAMHTKEGWALAQIIEAADPTIIFWKSTYNPVMPELRQPAPAECNPKPDRLLCSYCDGRTIYESVDAMSGAKYEVSCLHCNETGFADGLPRMIGKVPELGMGYEPSKPHWTDEDSDLPIPEDQVEAAVRFIGNERGMDVEQFVKDFNLYFKPRKGIKQVTHTTLPEQVQFIIPCCPPAEIMRLIKAFRVKSKPDIYEQFTAHEVVDIHEDDPLNPKHYHGRECADIGELLTANSYQVLKYNWRLGEKDSPCVELGKALWYLDSEITLHGDTIKPRCHALPDPAWFDEKLHHATDHAKRVARILIAWNRYGNRLNLKDLRKLLQGKLDDLNGCTEWGRGLEP